MSDIDLISFGNTKYTDVIKIDQATKLELGNINGDKIIFHENGNIQIEGNLNNAMDYVINMCWELFDKQIEPTHKTIEIFDYLLININNTTVDYLKPNPSEEFFQFKTVIEDKVFRKIRLKAFL